MVYIKDDQVVLENTYNRFIYETIISIKFENVFSTASIRYFSCNKDIPNIIRSFQVNSYIEVECSLYSAPKNWLIDNEFELYVKPEKKKKL